MGPKISVIIPAYNEEKYLRRCLDSVFASDFIDSMEVILVNDGSVDGTLAAAAEYLKYPNFILIDQENQGTARARWSGIRASAGEYFSFIDADDYIAPGMMSAMYDAAKASGADVSVCGIFRVIDGKVIPHRMYGGLEPEGSHAAIRRIITENLNFGLCNKLISRRLITEEDCEKTIGIEFSEDLLLLFYALRRARKIAYLPGIFYFYVATPGSATQSLSAKSWQDRYFVHVTVYRELKKAGIPFSGTAYHKFYMQMLVSNLRKGNNPKPGKVPQGRKAAVMKRLREMGFKEVFSLKSKKLFFDYCLVRLHLFGLFYSAWESRLLYPVREFRRRRSHRGRAGVK